MSELSYGAPALVAKLASIVNSVGRLEKRGHNDFHNYDYVTESDVVEALRAKLSAAGIVCVPQVEVVRIEKLEKGVLATIESTYVFTDGNEVVSVRVGGMGYDTPGDKAVYKAMTGAEKYALKQLFLIPTGDDPERDSDSAPEPRSKRPDVERGLPAQRRDPVPKDRGSEGASVSSAEKDRTVAFGPNKGKKLEELNDQDLAAWTKTCERLVGEQDKKWHKFNVQRLDACKSEWEKRQDWRKPWKDILAVGEKYGLNSDGVEVVLRERMGIKSAEELKADDVMEFEAHLKEMQQEK